MTRKSRENPAIREFILRRVERHPNDIASLTAKSFSTTRVTANRYLHKLVQEGVLTATGATRARSYELKASVDEVILLEIVPGLAEDIVYRNRIEPFLVGLPENIMDMAQYGVTEMVNNVIDHSEGTHFTIQVMKTARRTIIIIADNGVGIFRKISREHNLIDERHAILELSKGKLTTDPSKHSGEGIFFTSRMFGRFTLFSCDLVYEKIREQDDEYLVETAARLATDNGTAVRLEIDNEAKHTMTDVFRHHEDDENRFSKTHVPVNLARYGEEKLVSRSQARRVLARFENFSEVMLDFSNVSMIGQAFADEIFRVYANEHPEVAVIPILASPEVKAMIQHVTGDRMIVANALSEGSSPV